MQHKQFRIEKMLANGRGQPSAPAPVEDPVATFKRSLAALVADDDGRRLTRAAAELGAAIESMEKATQVVLAAAESIDGGCERAPEMRQRIAQIYEACNFQDLAGQRIGKVIALLTHLEEQLAHVAGHGGHSAPGGDTRDGGLINGPRLDGASGHVSQSDIDLLFG